MTATLPKKSVGKKPCQHTEGYWIQKNVSFRCTCCGYQFQIKELPKMTRKLAPN